MKLKQKQLKINSDENIVINESGTYHYIYNHNQKYKKNIFKISDNIKVNIIEFHKSLHKKVLVSYNAKIEVGNNSLVNYSLLNVDNCLSLEKKVNITINKDSEFKLYFLDAGSSNNSFYNVDLLGEGACIEFNVMNYLDTNYSQTHNIKINHLAKRTKSNMYNYAVITDSSKCTIHAVTFVQKDSNGSSAFQDNKVIMLSDSANNQITPQLLIDCFDIKGGHAATSSRVSQDELYYMQSRGLDINEANRLIVIGHLMKNVPGDLIEIVLNKLEGRISNE